MAKVKPNKFRIIIFILIIVIIGGTSFAGWYIWQKNQSKESQQTDSKITRYKGLNVLKTDSSYWPGASASNHYNYHFSIQESQKVNTIGFSLDEVTDDYIKLSVSEMLDEYSDDGKYISKLDSGEQFTLYNGVTIHLMTPTADAGTSYSFLYIK